MAFDSLFSYAEKYAGKFLARFRENPQHERDYHDLGYYGIIGNLETAGLIGTDGSLDWLCLPHLESPSVFAKLLDAKRGGRFVVQPRTPFESTQNYLGDTNVLQTHFRTGTGEATLTDFMPPFKKRTKWHKHHTLFRRIEGIRGFIPMRSVFEPRFNYARGRTTVKAADGCVTAGSGGEKLFLDAAVPFLAGAQSAQANFSVSAGEEQWVVMQYGTRHAFTARARRQELMDTISFWARWVHTCDRSECVFRGEWHDIIVRSGLVLKLLTHGETGAIAAAATTSLPEVVGGERNWDYRFNWIRDSVFTAQALFNLGHHRDAKQLLNWYKRIYRGVKVSDIAIMQGLHGEPVPHEKMLRHLEGYRRSKPVRIGNGAARQKQLDIYGELLSMAYETTRFGETISKADWKFLRKTANYVCKIWREKDSGIWEVRGRLRHYVFSKIMCFVALDRALKISEKRGLPAPTEKWQANRDAIKKIVLRKGYDKKLGSFVQAFGSSNLDATSLLIPILGFLPADDPRVASTVAAIRKKLARGNLIYRYDNDDGLPGKEGAFIMCTLWLVDALALAGKVEEAEKIFTNILHYASPLGLFAEEIEPRSGTQLGNYPQAFSHTALINSALYLGIARSRTPPPKSVLLGFPLRFLKKGPFGNLNIFGF